MAEPLAKSSASTGDYYDEYWSGRSGWRPTDQLDAQLKAWIDHCAWPGKSLLDVGCGDASRYAPYLLQQGFALSGVDVSEEAVRAACERGVEATVAPLDRELPYSDCQFDGALCLEVFEHLLDPEFACREIFRALRPGGLFLTSVPNSAALRNRIELLILGRFNPTGSPLTAIRSPWRDPHIRFFNSRGLARMLTDCGFVVERRGGLDTQFLGTIPILRRLIAFRLATPLTASTRWLGAQFYSLFAGRCVVVGRKPLE